MEALEAAGLGGETQHPAPEEDVDVPPPDDEEIRRGVEKGTDDAFKS